MYFCCYPSPLGNLILAEEEDAIVFCQWEDTIDEQMIAKWTEDREQNSVLLTEACRQLTEYFTQKRKTFNLPIRLNGTPFQQIVWKGVAQHLAEAAQVVEAFQTEVAHLVDIDNDIKI